MDDKTRLKARELLLRSRIYRFSGLVFACLGVFIFVFLYLSHIEGHFWSSLRRPDLVAMIFLPFVPAAILSMMAARAEKKFMRLFHQDTSSSAGKKKQ